MRGREGEGRGARGVHLDEALQRPARVADAPLPVLAAGSPGHGFELCGAVPVLALLDASAPASWNHRTAGSRLLPGWSWPSGPHPLLPRTPAAGQICLCPGSAATAHGCHAELEAAAQPEPAASGPHLS